ncbi:MAG: hypothetical protein AAF748_09180 [Pseudomonadota bacterium]
MLRPLLLTLVPALLLMGCASAPPSSSAVSPSQGEVLATRGISESAKIAALETAILGLGAGIDPGEAARVARLAVEYPLYTLAPRYQVEDPPLIHNMKVNMGTKPRGLCYDWADDLEARLRQEGLQTVTLHRAIANHNNIRIEHSTVVVSAVGDTMAEGIVLDPWRLGMGVLFWAPVAEDSKYDWWERQDVFAYKRARGRM